MGLNSLLKKVETRTDDIPDGNYVVNVINEVTEKLFINSGHSPSKYYTPSSIGGCNRKNYYKKLGAPIDENPDVEVKNCKKANSGTDRHDRIQKKLIKAEEFGFDVEWVDVRDYVQARGMDYLDIKGKYGKEYAIVDKRYNLSFKIDGLLKVKDKYMIVEIKTDDTYRWGRRQSISKYHEMQGYCYSLSLNIPFVLYIYEERNEFKLKPFEEKITDKQKQKVINKIEKVDGYVDKKQLPSKDLSSCKFCNYKDICKKDLNVGDFE